MIASEPDAESNIREFLEKYGREGFLRLMLTNYLYELAMYYLHSEKNIAHGVREDTSYRVYVDGREQVYPPAEIEKFKNDLRAECRKKADAIVETLKGMGILDRLNEDITEDSEVAKLVEKAFESITHRT